MRHAPKWRAFIPTSREIRFSVQKALGNYAPHVLRRVNIYMDQGDWNKIAVSKRNIELESETSLNIHDTIRYKNDFQLELKRCHGTFHTNAKWNIEIAEFDNALIFAHSGQAIDKNSLTAITAVGHNFARPYIGGKRIKIDIPCVNFLNARAGEQNFYHYMLETTVQLIHVVTYISSIHEKMAVLVRPPLRENEKIFRDYIESQFTNVVFLEVNENHHIHADCLYQHRMKMLCRFRSPSRRRDLFQLANIFKKSFEISKSEHKRNIYISRKDVRVRKISNEAELIRQLEKKNFTVIAPGQLSLHDQVELFSQARCVVGAHGAGLTNIMYMQPGGQIIEIFGSNYVQGAYMWLSNLMDHKYDYVIGTPDGGHQHLKLSNENIEEIISKID